MMVTKVIVVIASGWCKSNHFAVHSKLIQCCIAIISQYLNKTETKKIFYSVKGTVKRIKRQVTDWEKILQDTYLIKDPKI